MKTSLPLFYFKPTICWVDDDQLFLDAVNISFKNHYNCLTFNDPKEAVEYFNQYKSPISAIKFKRDFIESDLFGTNDHHPVNIHISSIKDVATLEHKNNELAVLIIDYNMPGKNGLELCEQLKSMPIKKILLTGETTHERAIEAFNNGLIDKFIEKNHRIAVNLQKSIDELIYLYFQDKTKDLVSHLEASNPSPLTDYIFIDFFNDWRIKNNIEEFYLINKNGSFLVKNKDGKTSYFIVMSESDKNEFISMNDETFDNNHPLFNKVKEGKLIPFFGMGIEAWKVDLVDWEKYFYQADEIVGRENYYLAIINE